MRPLLHPLNPLFSVRRRLWPLPVLIMLTLLLCALGTRAFADDFLEPEKAFQIEVTPAGDQAVDVGFRIAQGYYMYRGQFKFSAEGASLGEPAFPPGHVKFDETFQKNVETYRDQVHIRVPVSQAGAEFRLTAIGQGCADRGLCYPPMPSIVVVKLKGFGGDGSAKLIATGDAATNLLGAGPATSPVPGANLAGLSGAATPTSTASLDADTQTNTGTNAKVNANGDPSHSTSAARPIGVPPPTSLLDRALQGGGFWTVVVVFFGAGVLLSLTPCVLPMLPILSSIIAGQAGGTSRRGRSLMLAAIYSLGMALVYTALGIAAGLAGEGLAAALQTPAVLGAFAALLVVLSLSMFGVYELRMPSRLTGGLATASTRMKGGRAAGVFLMGGLSALIVSPCVAAPLAGALVYLSQTRDVFLGGAALFALAAGMSVPLLLVGASAGAILPKAGPWMEGIKQFFGLMLIAVAIWMIEPLLPTALMLALWGALLALAAVMLRPFTKHHRGRFTTGAAMRRTAGVLASVFALLEFVGAASGGSNPLQPLAQLAPGHGAEPSVLPFRTVHSVAELDAALQVAGRPVMLDFYADWCVSCKEMERFTFTDPAVQKQLAGAVLLKADVTRNDADDRALLRRFQLFGPPGTIFFDAKGQEVRGLRVVGFEDAQRFRATLGGVGL